MDQLAYKYMELCKVESSTDSDSEISPRWSDTSTLGCVSSTPESGTFRRTLPLTRTPAGRHGCYSLFLDPYDGSSEDSDESNLDVGVTSRQTRQQGKSGGGGGCRFLGRRRRFLFHHPASVALREVAKNGTRDPVTEPQQHLPDVQMKCGSDSELCVRDIAPSHSDRDGCRVLTEEPANDPTMHSQTTDIEMHCQSNDSGLNVTIPSTSHLPGPVTSVEGTLSQRLDSSSETSPRPCNLRSIYKRKLGFPEAEVGALGQRKRQCVVDMHDEPKEKDSASEPCLSQTTV
ncbi:uncharacterized protein LOC130201764 [Pseudoliparis swirei]|uniref:uncharacterized protein LOC130201764 n=1 Tax=Pseudoliparis swirei TaxID=2059687 RepID=UPI0024BD67F7|nr:uncharacterized protein LOC130201764 [Pseudoliparis swirei]XP_056282846.1 uncharacterized protein LOC130201764 [Pseudoliparis swirei]